MPITFYNMTGCGYCSKAKTMFAAEIASGEMLVKDAKDAPQGTRGFPTFTNNGQSHSGLPGSKQELYSKLGYSGSTENYQNNCKQRDLNLPKKFWGIL